MLTKRLTKLFTQETARVKSISFHPQKPVFITGLHNGTIKAWDYQSNACMHDFNDHDGSVRVVTFHPQGDFFISAGDDKIIRLWDYTKRVLSKKFKGHSDFVRALDFHPTKPWFVSSSDDQTIKVWNFMTGKCLGTATGHSHYVMAVRFINESTIISGSLDQSLRLWSCDGLITKKSSFVPSVIVKQILNGHDRGINTVFVSDNIVVSGGDDREVKLWEYNGNELVERDSFFNHQGCITSVSYGDQCVVSVGEEGNLVIYDLIRKHFEKANVKGRFWTVSQKKNIVIAGHDSGFEIFKYDDPKIVCKSETGYFYTKDQNIFYSNLKTEKKVCDPTGLLLSMHSLDKLLLVQFSNHFEVYRKNRCILKEYAEGALIKYKGETGVVIREKSSIYIKSLDGEARKVLDITPGSLMHGGEGFFFVKRGSGVVRYSSEGDEKMVSLGFSVENIEIDEDFYAFMSKNDIHLYDKEMNLINTTKEIVNIHGGFFYKGIFIYATTKHLKYIFQEEGVIRSIDTEVYPFYYTENQIFYLSNEGFESIDVDLTEIDFKKLVIEGGEVNHLIEKGRLPGLSPLNFLIKKQKGEIALPYIKDVRQRFELCLADNKLEECLEYCRRERDSSMYKSLSERALKECEEDIVEECLIFLEEWYDLFMLYICSRRENKLDNLFKVADEQTKKMVKLYQEDKSYFYPNDSNEDRSNDSNEDGSNDSNEVKSNDSNEDRSNDSNEDGSNDSNEVKSNDSNEVIKSNDSNEDRSNDSNEDCIDTDKSNDCIVNKKLWKELIVQYDTTADDDMESAYNCVTKGKLSEALEYFYQALYATSLDEVEKRRIIGSYLSGLEVEIKRVQERDDRRFLQMAKFFSELDLKREHHLLARSGYVYACVKKGNLKTAKEVAQEIAQEEENVVKVVAKALKIEDGEDLYDLKNGTFCYDILEVSEEFKTCKYCFTNSKEGRICTLCKVGYLQD
ncbi:putative coatomer subunit alpha [Nosema granulosis]|uniref:Coatomer subunit alpha n=1 Tax=Nosema granulosis TaxID=83296 RepID=A0A9P6GZ57_9MICR|nr:putative coatomer subunit alpha [Nosema granulosis]